MTKVLIFILKLLSRILEWILILVIVFAFAIRLPHIQTLIAQKATDYLSNKLDRKISIGRLDVLFYNQIILDDVHLDDVNRDTLAEIGQLKVSLNYFRPAANVLSLQTVSLKDTHVHLRRDSLTRDFNFQYLIDFFSSGKSSTSRPFTLKVHNLILRRIHFVMDDEKAKHIPFGVDYSHLNVDNLYLSAKDIQVKGADVTADIEHISLREQSGFRLAKLQTQAKLSNEGLYLSDLNVLTNKTKVHAPKLNFVMHQLSDFANFVDAVKFDAVLDESQVDMKDVSYFAPQLEGMDEIVQVRAKVKNNVNHLAINDLKLNVGRNTVIEGNLKLLDFTDLNHQSIQQELTYAYFDFNDLKGLKLPMGDGVQPLNLGEPIDRLGFAKIDYLRTSGTWKNLSVRLNSIQTGLGNAVFNQTLLLSTDAENTMNFSMENVDKPLEIQQFNLGKFLDLQPTLGIVDGTVNFAGSFSADKGVELHNVNGNIRQFEANKYAYSNIALTNVSYGDMKVVGNVKVTDPNANLTLDGNLDLGKMKSYQATMDIQSLNLSRLNLFAADSLMTVTGKVTVDLTGQDLMSYNGKVSLNDLTFTNGNKSAHTDVATMELVNSKGYNSFFLRSDVADIDLNGIIDYNSVIEEVDHTLAVSLPAVFKQDEHHHGKGRSIFNYVVNLKNVDTVFHLFPFLQDLSIASGTKITGKFNSFTHDMNLSLHSNLIRYQNFMAEDLNIGSSLTDQEMFADIEADHFHVSDSIALKSFDYHLEGITDSLKSVISWGKNTSDESLLKFKTKITSLKDIEFDVEKSYFSINSYHWNIDKESLVCLFRENIDFGGLQLSSDDQSIVVDGRLSSDLTDKLQINVNNLDLDRLSNMLGLDFDMEGKTNGFFTLRGIFSDKPQFTGVTNVKGFVLNKSEIGDISALGFWNAAKKSITVSANLLYKQQKTFNLIGNYYVDRPKDNLDFKLEFDKTNIAFLNAFMDPKVISNIRGKLVGALNLTGELSKPIIQGELGLNDGNVKVGMFGVNYGFNGKVKVEDGMIQIDNMPIFDEDGNRGYLNGSILHENFSNFNFDIFVGLDNVRKPNGQPGSFLAMNTKYQEGTLYYGKAFVTGWVGISGYLNNLGIEVNLKTEKNTAITIPLYGAEEVDDVLSYGIFNPNQTDTTQKKPKLDLLGVNLNLNFDVTPDALVKLVFDEQTGDEMAAHGSGNISIKLDASQNLSMDGTYTLTDGYYNFVLNPIRKRFLVGAGSSISWTGGSPTDALLNIMATYRVNTDLSGITPDLASQSTASMMQNVNANIYMTGNLDAPKLAFELEAPKASDAAKVALARINSDPDELNKQFFMLLLSGSLQATNGSAGSAGSNAGLNLLSGQINNLLDQVSKDVRLNVNLQNNEETGINSQAIGFETNVLNNRLTVKGNFGVQNYAEGQQASSIIGDLNLEYRIDEAGRLRISLFNESNTYSVIQNQNLGMFTQGVGLIYQESFGKTKDMKLLNFIADWFRHDKYFKNTKHRRQKLLPEYQKAATEEKKDEN